MVLAVHGKQKRMSRGALWGLCCALGLRAGVPLGGAPLAAGFQRQEAAALLELLAVQSGSGVAGQSMGDSQGWTLVANGWDPGNLAMGQGYGPFGNRWQLWKQNNGGTYAVAIRGTIKEAQSIDENLMENTIRAEQVVVPAGAGRSISFRLASVAYKPVDQPKGWPVPEVHVGFAYGLAAVLFDRSHGLLKVLQREVPPGGRLLVTGHSQGAAIATLLHSFLHYAGADGSLDPLARDPEAAHFGLEGKHWSIKTYAFAQPKPGNWRYAMDLAEAIGNGGKLFAINNYDDPVVQAPLALQKLSDSFTQQEADAVEKHRVFAFCLRLATGIRSFFSHALDEGELDKVFLKGKPPGIPAYGEQLDPDFTSAQPKHMAMGGTSLNYTQAGTLIAVRPHPGDNPPELEASRKQDFLWEHHLYRYKQLSKYWP